MVSGSWQQPGSLRPLAGNLFPADLLQNRPSEGQQGVREECFPPHAIKVEFIFLLPPKKRLTLTPQNYGIITFINFLVQIIQL